VNPDGGGSDDAVTAYLRDLTVPPKGLTCPAQTLSFTGTPRAAVAETLVEVLPRVTAKIPALPRR
jgi:hypothetical protein